MANQKQVDLIKQDINAWNTWRQEHPEIQPDLSRANLSEADLSKANLSETNLSEADLSRTELTDTNFFRANLTDTNLSRAEFFRVDLIEANLSKANLSRPELFRANLSHANLSEVNFTGTWLAFTIFSWVDLCNVNGLETVVHYGPSSIDVNSVTLPQGDTRAHFLRGAGFPDTFIDYLPSLLTMPLQYHSLFLSHSHLDHLFTKKLHDDLQNKGVRCWFASHDLRPGTPIVRGIDEAIHLHDKLLLVLSKDAIRSNWVQQEVEAALYKETTTSQEILFPIRLDNAALVSETLWAQRLRTRHIGDFTNWQNEAAYQQAFRTLLQHLKVVKPSPR